MGKLLRATTDAINLVAVPFVAGIGGMLVFAALLWLAERLADGLGMLAR